MIIERTEPIRIHKGVVIAALLLHPEDIKMISPSWRGTVEEFIAVLRADPKNWIVFGKPGLQD